MQKLAKHLHSTPLTEDVEWLEPDGLGGYAFGTAPGRPTRRYHALLLTATSPPTGRFVLVNGFDAWIDTPSGRFDLSTQRYVPNVLSPDGRLRLQSFLDEPWPTWRWQAEDDTEVTLELFVPHEISACVLTWKLNHPRAAVRLSVRPFLSGRDYHNLHHENPAFRFEPDVQSECVTWKPYASVPATTALSNGGYQHDPEWYRQFLYVLEQERGLDCVEDLASPGTFSWDLRDDAVLIFGAEGHVDALRRAGTTAVEAAENLRESERKRRTAYASLLRRSADAYLVRRGSGKTIIAGYPWFTDWGRDTFIALRGLCLATSRLEEARDILIAWAGAIDDGMVPNRFPDQSGPPEFNSVDASLWYIIAVYDYLKAAAEASRPAPPKTVKLLNKAVQKILTGYYKGTRYGIRCDEDGLLAAGVPGVQLTWMDAKVGDWVVTPRIGKPVEVQALWLCALRIGAETGRQWLAVYDRGLASFRSRFWNADRNCLYDVIDVDHRRGTVDARVRPNQIFAIGGLPWNLLDVTPAQKVLDVVESRLWTPIGLRSLEPDSPDYAPRYVGDVRQRDAAYHQGTVWTWLAGPFIEAWLRVHGKTAESVREAQSRLIAPLMDHLNTAGLGHLSEIADGDEPHTPRGCPFQAWSVGELLRIEELLRQRSRP